jgi:twitching motility protein PilT
MDDIRLGAILLEGGTVDEADLERCLAIQALTGGSRPIGQILVEQGLLDKATLQRLLDLQRDRVERRKAEFAAEGIVTGALVRAALANGASEMVVSEGRPVRIRVGGDWRDLTDEAVRGPEVWDFVRETMGSKVLEELADRHFVVRAWREAGVGSGTATAFRQSDGVAGRIVFAADAKRTPEDVGVPKQVCDTVRAGRGLVLLVGERGVGRAELLGSLVRAAAADPARYVVVLDDEPAEAAENGALVTSRRMGIAPADRATALRAAVREDPDVLVIGDVGDPETFELALRAAEGGRLVVAYMDSANATAALQRILNFYPAYDVARVRSSLAAVLSAVLVRHLLPDATHAGMTAATELLLVDDALREVIRSGDVEDVALLLRIEGGRCGHSLDRSMLELIVAGRVRFEDAFARAEEKAWLLERTRNLPAEAK